MTKHENPNKAEVSPESFDAYVLKTDHAEIGVNPAGGYVSSWKVKNTAGELVDVLYRGSALKRTGIPILFPYFSKTQGQRSHGFGRDEMWNMEDQRETSLTMSLSSETISPEAKQEFPYLFSTSITVEVTESGELLYSLVVKNEDAKPFQIGPGVHPYWAVDHQKKTEIVIDGIDGFESSAIDWDTTPPDTAFAYTGPVTLRLPTRSITIADDGSSKVRHIVVWSQPITKEDFNFVCVEPISFNTNSGEDTPITVAPGESWTMKLRFSCHLI